MIFRKGGWGARRRIDGRDGRDGMCLAVRLTYRLLYCDKSQSSLVDETPREGTDGN